jgi:hypothetical protein
VFFGLALGAWSIPGSAVAHDGAAAICQSVDPTNSPGCWKSRSDSELAALIGGGAGSPFEIPIVCGDKVYSPAVARDILRGGGESPCARFKRDALAAIFNIRRSLLVGDGKLGKDGAACFGHEEFRIVLRCGGIFVPDEGSSDPDDALAVTEATPIEDLVALGSRLCVLGACPSTMDYACGKTLDALAGILNFVNASEARRGDCGVCRDDVEGPTLSCPPEVFIECAGHHGTPIDYEVSVSDDCDPNPSLFCYPPVGALIDAGAMINVHCVARDLQDNARKCVIPLDVVDTTPPAIHCPSEPIIVDCVPAGRNGAVVEYPAPAVTDVCDPAPVFACEPPSGSFFPIGVTTVQCVALDASGNLAFCSFEVDVVEAAPVTLFCSGDIAVECAGAGGAAVEYPMPIVSSTCTVPPEPACDPPSGSVFPIGATTVTCSTIGGNGEVVQCQFVVSVVDTRAPVIACPLDITVECGAGGGAVVDFEARAVDLCDPEPALICEPPPGSFFPLGATTVTCIARDLSGNESRCSFEVTVRDTEAPSIACPQGPVLADCSVFDPLPGAIVHYAAPVAADDCDGPLQADCDAPSGSFFPLGSTTVTCTAVDAAGNRSSCSFEVQVVDAAPPMISCPEELVFECAGPAGRVVEYPLPVVADDCDAFPDSSCGPPSGSLFPIGRTMVSCTARDDAGNAVSCAFAVVVEDSTPPELRCPGDIAVECESAAGTEVDYSVSAMDDCDGALALECSHPPGSAFPPGATLVRCSAVDAFGNRGACEFAVNVVDTTAPEIRCPPPVVAECAGAAGTPVAFAVDAADACGGGVKVVCDPPSGSLFPLGVTIVRCRAADPSGNVSSCELEVRVVDTTPPAIACPVDAVVIECEGGEGGTAQYPTPTATDLCDAEPVVECEPPSGALLPLGRHVVRCTARDAAGNAAGCDIVVEVVDSAPPELVCAVDITRECTGPGGAAVEFPLPTASDTCSPAPNLACLPMSGSMFPLGKTVVTCTADDQSGNLMTCKFNITVVDTTPPSIQCPGDISAACTSERGAPVNFAVQASDLCDPHPMVVCVPPSGSVFALGETVVVCTATDREGNASECRFVVTVRDEVPPMIICPEDFDVACGAGGQAVVEYPLPSVKDDCDPRPVVICDPPSGSALPAGAHVIRCTATDHAGNAAICEFTVRVVDEAPPELICPPDVIAECQGPQGTIVDYPLPVANDACDGQPPVVCAPPPGSAFPLGSTEVVCSSRDRAGNETRCTFVVAVVDSTPPELTPPAPPILVDATSSDGAMVLFDVPDADVCDPQPTVVCTPPSGSVFPIGQTMVTCRGVDGSGNETEVTHVITVVDRVPPDIECPEDFEIECTTNGTPPHKPPGWPPGSNPPPNACTAVLEYPPPAASDRDSPPVQVVCDPPSGTKLPMGTHVVTCRARDAAGNESTCTFTVRVVLGLRAFVRGDSNADSLCDIADAVWTVSYLFLGAPPPTCDDAADSNDDGRYNLADAVYVLDFNFRGSAPPPEPFLPLCGLDPTTEDPFDCLRFRPCE